LAALRDPRAARIVVAERGRSGGRLVFVREDGDRFTDLTAPPATPSIDVAPAWSPDGMMIVFASSRGQRDPRRLSLWIQHLLDEAPFRLTKGAVDSWPAFSPDGRAVVFASDRGGAGFDLWRLELPRGPDGRPRAGALRRLTRDAGDEIEPAWSPRGDAIVYVSVEGGVRRLRSFPGARELSAGPDDGSPAWHPDGHTIVFTAGAPARGDADLWLLDLPTGRRWRLVDDAVGDEQAPRFSADGRHVFATSLCRSASGEPLFSTLVFVDLAEEPARLRALYDRFAPARMSAALAPVPLDARMLARAPLYAPALERTLARRGVKIGACAR
jgi:Tol biopolymer transport system component